MTAVVHGDEDGRGEISRLLAAVGHGDPQALASLFTLVYDELRREAHRRRAYLRSGETLSTTALVHETYLKLVGAGRQDCRDRTHFFALAARVMRQILIDDARRRLAEKRGGGERPSLDAAEVGFDARAEELLALDEALTRLSSLDERLGHLVELRFYVGLSVEETAEILQLSPRTVKRDWRKARAFLHRSLSGAACAEADP